MAKKPAPHDPIRFKWTYFEIRDTGQSEAWVAVVDPDDSETNSWASQASADAVLRRLVEDDMVDPSRAHVYKVTVERTGGN